MEVLSPRGPRNAGQSSPAMRVPRSGGSVSGAGTKDGSLLAGGRSAAVALPGAGAGPVTGAPCSQPTKAATTTRQNADRMKVSTCRELSHPFRGRLGILPVATILKAGGLVTTAVGGALMLEVNSRIQIPDDEFEFTYA